MPKTTKKPDPCDDPRVAELMRHPVINQYRRIQFLRAAAALLEHATTSTMPEVEKLYDAVMKQVEEEAQKPFVRVYIGDREIWPDDADSYTSDNAATELQRLLAGRALGTRGRIEHYNGDSYELAEAYEVMETGVRRTERRAA